LIFSLGEDLCLIFCFLQPALSILDRSPAAYHPSPPRTLCYRETVISSFTDLVDAGCTWQRASRVHQVPFTFPVPSLGTRIPFFWPWCSHRIYPLRFFVIGSSPPFLCHSISCLLCIPFQSPPRPRFHLALDFPLTERVFQAYNSLSLSLSF